MEMRISAKAIKSHATEVCMANQVYKQSTKSFESSTRSLADINLLQVETRGSAECNKMYAKKLRETKEFVKNNGDDIGSDAEEVGSAKRWIYGFQDDNEEEHERDVAYISSEVDRM